MEERERGGWMEWGSKGREGERDRSPLMLANLPLFLSVDSEERQYIMETLNTVTVVSTLFFFSYSCRMWLLSSVYLLICLTKYKGKPTVNHSVCLETVSSNQKYIYIYIYHSPTNTGADTENKTNLITIYCIIYRSYITKYSSVLWHKTRYVITVNSEQSTLLKLKLS